MENWELKERVTIGMDFRRASFLLVITTAIFLALASVASGQSHPVKRLHNPATVRGSTGGETYDVYVIHAKKGKTMTISLAWKKEYDNYAKLGVSYGRDYDNVTVAKFGKEFNGGKKWVGKVPTTRDYYIDVSANPLARYTLRVNIG